MIPPPEVHAALLGVAAFLAIAMGGLILARNPVSTAARLHFVYATCLAFWFVCAAMIAVADSVEVVRLWSRLVHLSLGLFPGAVYHLNVALAGLATEYRRRVAAHWALSAGLVLFGLLWPTLLGPSLVYPWGNELSYSAWGLVIAIPVAVTLLEAIVVYRVALGRLDPGMARYHKLRAFMWGNVVASLAPISFLPTFGIGMYPFGPLVLTGLHSLALYGSLRYRLIQITPELAAEHILSEMPNGVLVTDAGGVVRVANRQAAECLGADLESLMHRPVGTVGSNREMVELLREGGQESRPRGVTYRDSAGKERHARTTVSAILDAAAFPVARLWVLRDVTDERVAELEKERMEESVRNVQKLESLGIMAAGVAHDFNNLLLAIQGNAELAGRAAGPAENDVRDHLGKIEGAAQRAADLAGQMLTYTGRRRTEMRPIDLNRVVSEVADLLGAAVSKKARVSLDLEGSLPLVLGEAGQMSQIMLNLMTNASEALDGEVGTITLRTGVCVPDGTFQDWSVEPRRDGGGEACAFIEAIDSGVGMDDATASRIFDPFFTTKFAGRGLGLATLVGIVRSHRGYTRVRSAPGRGTSFTVALPIANQAAESRFVRVSAAANSAARGRLGFALLADDEVEVRRVVHAMLVQDGFDVVEARDGNEAVVTFTEHRGEFAVVVLDHSMPGLDGSEAFARIRAKSPDVPVVFMSGYSETSGEPMDRRTAFLHKPFRAGMLTEKVQEVMRG